MEKRLGPDRSQRYFSYLNGYLSQRLSKTDFDKLCLQTLGRENLQMHNRLIHSILYNAYQAKCPPPPPDVGRPMVASAKKVSQATEVFNTCNGDLRLLQVQGSRPMSTVQDHPLKDRLNNMGPNSRVDAAVNHTQVPHGVSAARENGTVSSLESKRPVHFQQCEPAEPLAKQPRVEKLPPDNMLLQRRSMSSVADRSVEMLQSPVRAPLGIPFCSASVGGARKLPLPPISAGEDHFNSCFEHGGLFNTEALHRRMEKAAETLGLLGVTMDCAELLNSSLDKYLKNLIRLSVELIGASVQRDARKGMPYKQQAYGKQINGVRLPNHVHMHSGSRPSGAANEIRSNQLISLNDFKVAMQLNPQQLGEDWPVLLEKICLCSSEEND
uniref:Transcriptional regulator of RNA polII, SAGA, subunit n=1 Tax=Arundo donax TaxID=35708 RepID=A0A0A9DHH4_ARUDO